MLSEKVSRNKVLSRWKATRSGGGISVRGIDAATGGQARLPELISIEATDGGIIATDCTGTRHRLAT